MAITNLTNTKWELNDILVFPDTILNTSFAINFTTPNFTIEKADPPISSWERLEIGWQDPAHPNLIFLTYVPDDESWICAVYSSQSGWDRDPESGEALGTEVIQITGGQDAANLNLINWLQENATQLSNEVIITQQYLYDIGDAIREKNGLSIKYYPSQMASAIENISIQESNLDKLIKRTIVSASGSASIIGSYAFDYCTRLTTASFPAATSIGNSAFQNCILLTATNFPLVLNMYIGAFQSCTSLKTIVFPKLDTVPASAFRYCSSLETAVFPKANGNNGGIGQYAFANCTHLTKLLFPSVSTIPALGTSVFYSTPIGGYTSSTSGKYGYILVPGSLQYSWARATNWTTISSRIIGVYSDVNDSQWKLRSDLLPPITNSNIVINYVDIVLGSTNPINYSGRFQISVVPTTNNQYSIYSITCNNNVLYREGSWINTDFQNFYVGEHDNNTDFCWWLWMNNIG